MTQHGGEFVRIKTTLLPNGETRITPIDEIVHSFAKLLKRLNVKRPRIGFYSFRKTFRTIADESRDQPAVDFIMGHAPHANDMASRYRQSISDERLQRVGEHVRKWLFDK